MCPEVTADGTVMTGVGGVTSFDLPGASGELGRRGALTYELLAPTTDPIVAGASA